MDHAFDMAVTADGGYVMVGMTNSNDGDVAGLRGGFDVWVLRTDAAGELLWQRCFGGRRYDVGQAVHVAADGRIYVAGSTNSLDGDPARPNIR